MKIFICDSCNKQFTQPLDEVLIGGKKYDLCAVCRGTLDNEIVSFKSQKVKEFKGEKLNHQKS